MKPLDYGLLLVDKESGRTSFSIVAELRRYLDVRRVGHGGTLDPFASGLLPVAFGRATAALHYVESMDKLYVATIVLGVGTDSGDRDGDITEVVALPAAWLADGEERIQKAVDGLTGCLQQTPPMYSAVKIDGVPLYVHARRGQTVTRMARPVTVYEAKILNTDWREDKVYLRCELFCSKGTYVREWARTLGLELGLPAHVAELQRTAVGPFSRAAAVTTERLKAGYAELSGDSAAFRSWLDREGHQLPIATVFADWPQIELSLPEVRKIVHGQPLYRAERPAGPRLHLTHQGQSVAVALWLEEADRFRIKTRRVWLRHEDLPPT